MRTSRVFRWSFAPVAAAVAVLAIAGACSDSTGPQPGELDLVLTIASSDDRAVALTVTGAVTDVLPADGFRVFVHEGETETGLIAIPTGPAPFPTGDVIIATLEIPDRAAAADYSAAVVQVASADHQLRDAAAYSARTELRR